MSHHTKDKGDLGVAMTIADLVGRGYGICLPMAEHMPFDLIAISESGEPARVQVKYAKTKNHSFFMKLVSSYATSGGSRSKRIDFSMIDGWAVFNPEAGVIYVPKSEAEGMTAGLTFRIAKADHGPGTNRLVRDFRDPSVLWRARRESNPHSVD